MNNQEKYIAFYLFSFITMIVLTNIIGVKLFEIFPNLLKNPITLTTGIITYPITFLITDIVCEVFGKKKASLMVIFGFFAKLYCLSFL